MSSLFLMSDDDAYDADEMGAIVTMRGCIRASGHSR